MVSSSVDAAGGEGIPQRKLPPAVIRKTDLPKRCRKTREANIHRQKKKKIRYPPYCGEKRHEQHSIRYGLRQKKGTIH